MLAALGLGKKKAASEDQIRKHKEQRANCEQWREDVARLKNITAKLGNAYSKHKGDFALGRYEELKAMIKNSVKEYEACMEQKQKRPNCSTSHFAQKYSNEQPSSGKASSLGRLRDAAASFANSGDKVTKQEKAYSQMSSKEVEEDIEAFRREVVSLKKEYRIERDRLDKLAREYEESKKYNPTQRYSILKLLIKEATRAAS